MKENVLNIKEEKQRDLERESKEKVKRGERIRNIRIRELGLTKTELGRKIGVSSQFLGLVEKGEGNLMYKNIRKLKEVSGHSSDYILYGIDDNTIRETKRYLEEFTEDELINAIDVIKNIALFIKNQK